MDAEYTIAHFDFGSLPWLTNPRKKLQTEAVALGFIQLPPDDGYTFTHTHRQQEEVYIVIEGSGSILLNNKLLELTRGDTVRVAPRTRRALKAGKDGMLVICTGAIPTEYPHNPDSRYMIDDGVPDYDDIPPWHQENPEVIARNQQLKERMQKSMLKRKQQRCQPADKDGSETGS